MKKEPYDPLRLSFLILKKIRLFAYCVDCHHNAVVDTEPVAEKLGAEFPIPHVAARMKCGQCGSRQVTVNPNWNDEDVPGRPREFFYPAFD